MRTGTITLEHTACDSRDSGILVDTCLARLRTTAGLDIEPVFPPLHVLLGAPSLHIDPRHPAMFAPPPMAPVPRLYTPLPTPAQPLLTKPAASEKMAPRRLCWPVVFCAFVAGTFGGISVMKSPVGQRPDVQQVVKVAKKHVASATVAVKTLRERHS